MIMTLFLSIAWLQFHYFQLWREAAFLILKNLHWFCRTFSIYFFIHVFPTLPPSHKHCFTPLGCSLSPGSGPPQDCLLGTSILPTPSIQFSSIQRSDVPYLRPGPWIPTGKMRLSHSECDFFLPIMLRILRNGFSCVVSTWLVVGSRDGSDGAKCFPTFCNTLCLWILP